MIVLGILQLLSALIIIVLFGLGLIDFSQKQIGKGVLMTGFGLFLSYGLAISMGII